MDNTPVKDCINTICGYAFFATKARPQLHAPFRRTYSVLVIVSESKYPWEGQELLTISGHLRDPAIEFGTF